MEKKVKTTATNAAQFGTIMTFLTCIAFFIRFFAQLIKDDKWDHNRNWADMVYFLMVSLCTFFISVP